jgi:class 3 adenylate cyclase
MSRRPASRQRSLTGQNCTIVFTDVVGFGADTRTEFDRLAIRKATARMLGTAVVSPFKDACAWEDRGDGLLIVMYPEVPTAAALERLFTVLPVQLQRHNEGSQPGTRIQLRAAITVGPVTEDAIGLSGKAIISAARMLDSSDFKQAMTQTGSVLGVITSAFVYDLAIDAGSDSPGPWDRAHVSVKEAQFPAWVRLFEAPLIGTGRDHPRLTGCQAGQAASPRWSGCDRWSGSRPAESSNSAAVRAAVARPHRPVVSTPSRSTITPQPASTNQAG